MMRALWEVRSPSLPLIPLTVQLNEEHHRRARCDLVVAVVVLLVTLVPLLLLSYNHSLTSPLLWSTYFTSSFLLGGAHF